MAINIEDEGANYDPAPGCESAADNEDSSTPTVEAASDESVENEGATADIDKANDDGATAADNRDEDALPCRGRVFSQTRSVSTIALTMGKWRIDSGRDERVHWPRQDLEPSTTDQCNALRRSHDDLWPRLLVSMVY